MVKLGFDILDPRPIAATAPYTYFLPTALELAAVTKGDIVKLLFDYPHQTEKWAAERMWVIVDSIEGDDVRGILDNDPDEPTSPLTAGDTLTFQRHHILAIDWENPAAAPPAAEYREYWDRCMVDQCVLNGEEPVEYVYREESDLAGEDDEYPDSGWRIRGRMGSASDTEMDERAVAYVALGAVLNRDDSWLPWIDAPIGTALMRDFDTDEYVEQS